MTEGNDDTTVGYSGSDASIRFLPAATDYQPVPNDLYWKIALAVPDIELACEQLTDQGVAVSEPHQFQDVGYLAHFKDPAGLSIELIEHWFKGNRQEPVTNTVLLGGGAHLNLLTLRTAAIEPIQRLVTAWGMKPLSIQSVDNYGFTLYFFAFTNDDPPEPDLRSVRNREWLYQRPYTVLEVQHLHAADDVRLPRPGSAGYESAGIVGVDVARPKNELRLIATDTLAGGH